MYLPSMQAEQTPVEQKLVFQGLHDCPLCSSGSAPCISDSCTYRGTYIGTYISDSVPRLYIDHIARHSSSRSFDIRQPVPFAPSLARPRPNASRVPQQLRFGEAPVSQDVCWTSPYVTQLSDPMPFTWAHVMIVQYQDH